MEPEHPVITGPYVADLLAQPAAIRATWTGLRAATDLRQAGQRARAGGFDRLILTGMGSSFHALHPLAIELVEAGMAPLVIETSELVFCQPRLLRGRPLVVAVSQSGASAEIIRLSDEVAADVHLVAVTNTPTSPLAGRATSLVPLAAGQESTVSCKTYVASIVALAWLARVLSGRDPAGLDRAIEEAAAATEGYLTSWREHVAGLRAGLDGVHHLFVTGRGPSLAAAGTAGLIIKEAAHFPTEGMSAASFRHGPFEMAGPRTMVLACQGPPTVADLNRRLVGDVRNVGGRAHLVGAASDWAALRLAPVEPGVLPLVEILPFQMVSLALAARAGREAGRFERASKVTTVA